MFSDSSLYQGTIRFNILLGANKDVTDEEIDNAAKDANVFPFIT
jgi:ABC-type multidrug transport system fused ATPase/permease subunit